MMRTNTADGIHLTSRFGRAEVDQAATLKPGEFIHAGDNAATFEPIAKGAAHGEDG